jgi:hypothetical protein
MEALFIEDVENVNIWRYIASISLFRHQEAGRPIPNFLPLFKYRRKNADVYIINPLFSLSN